MKSKPTLRATLQFNNLLSRKGQVVSHLVKAVKEEKVDYSQIDSIKNDYIIFIVAEGDKSYFCAVRKEISHLPLNIIFSDITTMLKLKNAKIRFV